MLLTSVENLESTNKYSNQNEILLEELEHLKADLEREVTCRGRLEVELEQTRSAFKAAQKARETFQRAMAHKLRSPLNVILGFSELLLDRGLEDEEALDSLKLIDKGARALHKVIEGSLLLTRLECDTGPIRLEEANLYQLAGCEIEVFNSGEDLQIPIQLEKPTCSVGVTLDSGLITRVIRNLLENAIRFSPEGGRIRCKIEGGRDFLSFSVSDEGCGIPKKSLTDIFEDFMGSGRAGLGLALCREIIRRHEGRICAANNKNGGATFRFEIPTRVTK